MPAAGIKYGGAKGFFKESVHSSILKLAYESRWVTAFSFLWVTQKRNLPPFIWAIVVGADGAILSDDVTSHSSIIAIPHTDNEVFLGHLDCMPSCFKFPETLDRFNVWYTRDG